MLLQAQSLCKKKLAEIVKRNYHVSCQAYINRKESVQKQNDTKTNILIQVQPQRVLFKARYKSYIIEQVRCWGKEEVLSFE
jgi:hypothetical protein